MFVGGIFFITAQTNVGRDVEEGGAVGKAVWGCSASFTALSPALASTLPQNDLSSALAVLKDRESHPFLLEDKCLAESAWGTSSTESDADE